MQLRAKVCWFCAVSVLSSALIAPDAHARFIRFDLGSNWAAPTFIGAAPAGVANIAEDGAIDAELGFDIDFGLGPTSRITIHEDGFVTFGSGQQITLFDGPAFDFDSVIPDPLEDETPGALTYSQGVFELGTTYGSDPTDAFRVSWFDPPAGTAFQLLLRTEDLTDAGNFRLEFNYGCDPARPAPCGLTSVGGSDSRAGLALGDNHFAMTGPFISARNYDFRFVDGVMVDVPVAVPEPGSLALLMGGLAALIMRRRR